MPHKSSNQVVSSNHPKDIPVGELIMHRLYVCVTSKGYLNLRWDGQDFVAGDKTRHAYWKDGYRFGSAVPITLLEELE